MVLFSSSEYQSHLSTNTARHLQMIDELHKETITGENGSMSTSSAASSSSDDTKQDQGSGDGSLSVDKLKAVESEVEFLTDVLSGYGIGQLPALECIKTQLKMPDVEIMTLGDSCTFRMVNMSQHRETGQKWLSPHFLVRGGHKMRLAVYPHGIGSGEGSHLSLKLLLLFDDQFEWPISLPSHLGIRVELLIESDGLFEEADSAFDDDPLTATRALSTHSHNLECTWKPRGERRGSPRWERRRGERSSLRGERRSSTREERSSPRGERRSSTKEERSNPSGERKSTSREERGGFERRGSIRRELRSRISSRGERESSSGSSPSPVSPLTRNASMFDRSYSFNRKVTATALVRRSSFNEKSSVKSVSLEESRKRMSRILPPWLQQPKEPSISEKSDEMEKLTNGKAEVEDQPPSHDNKSSEKNDSVKDKSNHVEKNVVTKELKAEERRSKEMSKSPSFEMNGDGCDGATVFSMERFASYDQIDKFTQEYNSLVFQITLCLV